MWYACINCPSVFDTPSKLDNHYLLRKNRACHVLLLNRTAVRRSPRKCHDVPVSGTAAAEGSQSSSTETGGRRTRNSRITKESTPDPGRRKKLYYCPKCAATFDDQESHEKIHEVPCDTTVTSVTTAKQDSKKPSATPTSSTLTSREVKVKCKLCDSLLTKGIESKQHRRLHREAYLQAYIQDYKYVTKGIRWFKFIKEEDERTPRRSRKRRYSDFKTQTYDMAKIPKWGLQLGKFEASPPLQIPNSSGVQNPESTEAPNDFASSPAKIEPSQLPKPIITMSSHTDEGSSKNVHEGSPSSVKENLLDPDPIIKVEGSDVQMLGMHAGSPGIESGPSLVLHKRKSKETTRTLYHLCFFCSLRFANYLHCILHIIHDHVGPKAPKATPELKIKMRQFVEMLEHKHEMEALQAAGASASASAPIPTVPSPAIATVTKTTEVVHEEYEYCSGQSQVQPQGSKSGPSKAVPSRNSTCPKVVLTDFGRRIIMDCPLCPVSSLTLHERVSHMDTHFVEEEDKEVPLTCTICGVKAANLTRLKEHSCDHFKVKLHSCAYCWAGFNQSSTLQLHIETVHKEILKLKAQKSFKRPKKA